MSQPMVMGNSELESDVKTVHILVILGFFVAGIILHPISLVKIKKIETAGMPMQGWKIAAWIGIALQILAIISTIALWGMIMAIIAAG